MDINNYISSGIIEMYVMGLCSPEESTELELLRSQYPELNTAIIKFEVAFEKNALAATTETGDELDTKILHSLKELKIPAIALPSAQPKIKKMNWLRAVAAAAVLLLGISSVMNYTLYKKNEAQAFALNEKTNTPLSTLPQDDYKILRDPAITPVAMYGVAPYTLCRCTMYWDKKTGKAYIMIHHLVPSPQDKKYQLWATVNNKIINVGMVHDEIRDRFIELKNVPAGATAFTLTLEDIKGSPAPTEGQTFLYGSI
ncbi:anti-sigma factor domain-containing protein [Ferruginibacter sp.]|nr:anti-sigma factor [Ferruginibacter sp.]